MLGFATRLKEETEYKGLLQKELAAKANVKKRALDMYLGSRESMPPADVSVRLAQVLGVTVEYLVTGEDSTVESLQKDFIPFRNFNKKLMQLSKSSWEKLEPLFVAMVEQELKSELEKKETAV